MPFAPLSRRQFSIATGAALVAGFHPAHAQDDRIVLGQSAAFTGPAAQLGVQFHAGAKLYFDQLNAQGGVGGRSDRNPPARRWLRARPLRRQYEKAH